MKIVISLGGSLLVPKDAPLSSENFKKYVPVLKRIAQNNQLIVVCGGGRTARDYRDVAKEFTSERIPLDNVGTAATQLNAMTLTAALGESAHQPKEFPLRYPAAKKLLGEKILVFGGIKPLHSTDFDSVFLAKMVSADLIINVTNVPGVFSEDPRTDPQAKKFDKLNYDEFIKIIKKNVQAPGQYALFDLKGAKLLKKIKVKMIVIDGRDAEEIVRAVEGTHSGTVVE